MTDLRTESIPRDRYTVFLGKAEEFLSAAQISSKSRDTNAAASNAAHAAISALDAVAAYHLGLRCKGDDHGQVLRLLSRASLEGFSERERQFLQLLDVKRLAEYHARDVLPNESDQAVLLARRILDWARSRVPQSNNVDSHLGD